MNLPSDLSSTTIYEQFNACDKTAVISSEEQDGFCNFVRIAHPPHRYGAQEGRLHLLSLLSILEQATEARCVYRTRANSVDADLAVFQIDGPRTRERPYREPWSHCKHSTPGFLWMLRPKQLERSNHPLETVEALFVP